MSKAKRKPHSVMRVDDAVVHCIAMNTGSPTGRFRDSMGYDMLLQRTYAELEKPMRGSQRLPLRHLQSPTPIRSNTNTDPEHLLGVSSCKNESLLPKMQN